MHEFGIAEGLLGAVIEKAREIGAPRVVSIKLQIGALSGVEIDALTFAFTAISVNTPAEHAELKIETIPASCYCLDCDLLFECAPAAYACPSCQQVSPDMRTGRELKLVSMEVD
ncbi:MAG: hydrogenase maturation nickel metallochaperone HypA [Kiritimatiellia bacterium]|jgi:hydrogenase nickel incorporation protein HypA/HybF